MRNVPSAGLVSLAIALAVAGSGSAWAQDASPAPTPAPAPAEATPAAPADEATNEILVVADALRGQVDAPEPPLLELNQEDIAAYGAGSISDLLDALAPQTSSGRGRGGGGPAILVNGVRVSSFREIASYPPEAIDKVEVLPEEVALRYGFSADQRVVNFILKRAYSSRTVELTYGQPWRGGYSNKQAEATYLQIAGVARMNFNVRWNDTSPLFEAQRGIIQTTIPLPGDPDPALYRSLVADTAGLQVTGNYSTKLGTSGTALSLNGEYQRSDSLRFSGLDTVTLFDPTGTQSQYRTLDAGDPLLSRSRTNTYSASAGLNTSLGDWQVVATADGSHSDSRSRIDRRADVTGLVTAARTGALALNGTLPDLPDPGFDEALTRTDSATTKVTVSGRPVLLPAGFVSMTIDGGYDWNQIRSQDTRRAALGETSLVRGDLNAGVNVGVPITSRREDFLSALGDLNLNLTGGVDRLSDFGTLTDWTVGVTWSPFTLENLTLQASRIGREAAPSLSQLGSPETANFNVPVFDLTRGETVLATVITGGNPNLPSQKQNDWKFGANWQLPAFTKLIERANLSVEYFKNHSDDIASGFPTLTPTTEAAFPGRVTRDASGRIVSIDQRAVTLASQDIERLQFGLNLNGPFGKARPQGARQGNNPMQQAFAALRGGQPGGAPQIPQGNGQGAAPGGAGGPRQGGQGGGFGGGGNFNPQVFQDLRAKWCAPDAAGKVPSAADLAALPEQLTARLKKPDGTIDPAAWAELRTRVCSNNGPGGGGNFNAGAFQRLRTQFCDAKNADALPTAEQLAGLPEQLVSRIKKPDGTIDPALWKVFRDRICSANPPGRGQGGQAGQGGPAGQGGEGGPGGGPQFVIRGPGDGAPGGAPPPGAQTVIIGGPGGGGGFGGGGPGGGGAGGGFRGGGGGGFGGGQSRDGRGRWFLNLNYTRELSNEVLVAPGGPLLDLLNGDALTGGGQPRNSFNFNGGIFYHGFGGQVNARYTGESTLLGNGTAGSTDLFFDDYTTVGFRVFADLNQQEKLIAKYPLLKNTRISAGLNNVFDTRQRVTDSNGVVPIRYQPYLIDPVGRFLQIQVRKMF